MPYPIKGECRNTGRTQFKKGHHQSKPKNAYSFPCGNKHPRWKNGINKTADGHILIKQPNHPFATKAGYIRQSRLVMEQMLRRYLKPEEVVHHINGIKNDDRPENLQLFKNQIEHNKFHYPKGSKFGIHS